MNDEAIAAAGGLAKPTLGMALVRLLVFGVSLYLVVGIAGSAVDWTSSRKIPSVALLVQLLLCTVMVVAYWVAVRAIEQRRASELGWHRSMPLSFAGIVFGALLFCAVYGILWLAGVARFAGIRGWEGVFLVFVISVVAGIGEEILFRGVLYRIVENAFGTIAALTVSSALFGLAHAANPNATIYSTTAIALEAGLLLGLAYSATRNLWFPIGIHFAWNFTQTGIFGAPLSGFNLGGLLDIPLSGPEILTGGAFGPEASIVTLIVCLTASAVLGWMAVRSGQWRTLKASTRSPQP